MTSPTSSPYLIILIILDDNGQRHFAVTKTMHAIYFEEHVICRVGFEVITAVSVKSTTFWDLKNAVYASIRPHGVIFQKAVLFVICFFCCDHFCGIKSKEREIKILTTVSVRLYLAVSVYYSCSG
jgi:hypothetical protein